MKLKSLLCSLLVLFMVPIIASAQAERVVVQDEGLFLHNRDDSATGFTVKPVFSLDSDFSHPIVPKDAGVIAFDEDGNAKFSRLELRLMDGATQTYENEHFNNIQFLSGTSSAEMTSIGMKRQRFLMQAQQKSSGRVFYTIIEFNGDRKLATEMRRVTSQTTFDIYLIRNGLSGLRFKKYIQDVDLSKLDEIKTEIQPLGVLSFGEEHWVVNSALLVEESTKNDTIANIDDRSSDFDIGDGLYIDEEQFGRSVAGVAKRQVLVPICNYYQKGMAIAIQGTQYGDVSLTGNRCRIDFWIGSMEIGLKSATNIKCRNGRCSFTVAPFCLAQGTQMIAGCAELRDSIRAKFGRDGISGNAEISILGKVSNVEMDFEMKY